ncbi:DMT family transporter KNAG_0J00490 [Huiozyma naganishii CBS 8797]|uniref:EamA domain-containing protein n=1 Tax=Huiozyma naganishii (strain ATCC MYA-139 / BCRC 22969 / CBS 8797 / KCTC 17520 / NBRC 10181 / NCYC 3082 / Yp74L-3) TaxID=1071383 RepID=J7S2N0_HUIN7|nr:hypothetical protein KNAG_0J00490 [Kazachstania naganishii CBS 8797]CCK72132.1 hypothetical protein KNAG_0J00490 [Kazachstania naganishii CBS 8797]
MGSTGRRELTMQSVGTPRIAQKVETPGSTPQAKKRPIVISTAEADDEQEHEEVFEGMPANGGGGGRSHFNLERVSRWQQFKEKYVDTNVGLILLVVAQFFNTLMIVSTKLLETNPVAGQKIKPLQILVVRMAITYIGCLVYMYVNRATVKYVPFGDPKVRKWLILRGCTGFFGVFGSYFSLMYLSISDSVLISFLSPSITILLAWAVLRERIHRYEVAGCFVSLLGVVLIIRPPFLFGVDALDSSADPSPVESHHPRDRLIATLVALLGCFGMSCVYIIIRFIGDRAHAIMSVSYFSLITLIVSIIGVLTIPSMKFQMPHSSKEWLLFANLGISGFCFQLMLTMGIQRERAGRGSLITYTQLVYAIFWDVWLYHHPPSIWSVCGMFIIIGSTLYVVRLKNSGPTVSDDADTPSTVSEQDGDELEAQRLDPPIQLEDIER